jgi:predicted nucleic acid-binding protein
VTYDDDRVAPASTNINATDDGDVDVDVDRWFEASDGDADADPPDLLGDDAIGDPAADDDAEPVPPARGRRGRKPKVTGGDPGLAIFVDSSALIALVDRDDSTHSAAVSAYGNLLAEGYKLFTTNYVMAETFDLLSTGAGPDVARRFLRDCKIAIYHADEQDERRAKRVVLRQTGPNGLSLTDAISFVVMERLNVADAFAVDPGFLSNAT